MANTELVIKTQLKCLWDLPKLSLPGTGRILTKHFTNLCLTLPNDHLALFSFLIYQSGTNNSIDYTSSLLEKYKTAVELSAKKYGEKKLKISKVPVRRSFQFLIENGFLLRTGYKRTFLINPKFSYHKLYVKPSDYISWEEKYDKMAAKKDYKNVYIISGEFLSLARGNYNGK